MTKIYKEISELLEKGERAVMATVTACEGSAPRKPGAKMLICKNGRTSGTIGGGALEKTVCEKAADIMRSGIPCMLHYDLSGQTQGAGICGGRVSVFLEPILPAESLIIAGAGHIGAAVATIGRMTGFHVKVIDPRPELNDANRFSDTDSLMVCDYDEALQKIEIDQSAYVVICTHGHAFDEECLYAVCQTDARYVGMVGSRKKVTEIKERLQKRSVPKERLDRIYAPVGLAIGAQTPEEIAVSIMAEIIKIRRDQQPWTAR